MMPRTIRWSKLFRLARKHGASKVDIAQATGIPRNTLSSWCRETAQNNYSYSKAVEVWNFIFGIVPLEEMHACCEFEVVE